MSTKVILKRSKSRPDHQRSLENKSHENAVRFMTFYTWTSILKTIWPHEVIKLTFDGGQAKVRSKIGKSSNQYFS